MKLQLKILSWLRLLVFPIFFFALFAIVTQTKSALFIAANKSEIKEGYFHITNTDTVVGTKSIKNVFLTGNVNDSLNYRLPLKDINESVQSISIDDSLLVWYFPASNTPLFVKEQSEQSFNVFKHIYSDFRVFIILGIPLFIVVSIFYKRVVRNSDIG